ncbi:Atrophin-1 multi-domain protein [Pseudorhodoferax sp.]|uniref:Atrophin-1 multi-domain protein n=1 Tax=Pseudorhodoferax sp. TaxID=1993553 RepID=UPI002DD6A8E3|nr:Atrophin-1 multi-domain protein [Pseudorhodoferax sp.]
MPAAPEWCGLLAWRPRAWLPVLALAVHCAGAAAAEPWGSYLRPFDVQSPWNARPVAPVLGDYEIPQAKYYPNVAEGRFSTGVFLAAQDDPPVEVFPMPNRRGVWDPDAEQHLPKVVVPHWPKDVVPASGADGHADIVDPVSGIVHSFFQLRMIEGRWVATQYAWTRLAGRGWGEPGHYFQGARAAGVPTMAGIIRKHELRDGDALFRHALAMSLDFTGLSASPTYIFPATAADATAATTNSGRIPEGALLMLPRDFDAASIQNPTLRKIAETFKVYGGYVVDRNSGTPYAIYVENGSNFQLHEGGWNNATARDLQRIRAALRQVVSVGGWLDGDGQPMQMEQALNMLSLRGPWQLRQGRQAGRYDTWQQAVVFEADGETVVQSNGSGRNLHPVQWAQPQAGRSYRLAATATGGASLRLVITGPERAVLYDSGELGSGRAQTFAWPAGHQGVTLTLRNGGGAQRASIGGSLVPDTGATSTVQPR